ncbi:MAG: hypothetical protein IE919_10015 [Thioclava sp.]|nr:hypothetical protein [Thioclava sp.]MBD3803559.1 hypothetical protein [Thioclava sp.]
MKGFEPVTLSWGGKSYTVPADRQLMLIAEIEDALSDGTGTPAVLVLMRKGGPSYARLAGALGAALRYAGAEVSDQEIYLSVVGDIGRGDVRGVIAQQNAILGILSIIAPPIWRQLQSGEDLDSGKQEGEAKGAE